MGGTKRRSRTGKNKAKDNSPEGGVIQDHEEDGMGAKRKRREEEKKDKQTIQELMQERYRHMSASEDGAMDNESASGEDEDEMGKFPSASNGGMNGARGDNHQDKQVTEQLMNFKEAMAELEMYKQKSGVLERKLSEVVNKSQVPNAIVTDGMDTAATTITNDDTTVSRSTKGSGRRILSRADQALLLKDVEVLKEIREGIASYVNKKIFPGCKFAIGVELEKKDDWKEGKVPENLMGLLLEYYRDYLDEDGNLIPEREANFKAFVYFVDRILSSVNAQVTNYCLRVRKASKLSKAFTVYDEAFALVMLENYLRRWTRMLEAGITNDKDADDDAVVLDAGGKERPRGWFLAKYTATENGKKSSGWSKEGVDKYGEYKKMVEDARKDEMRGDELDTYLQDYWCGGSKKSKKKKSKSIELVKAIKDESIFGGQVAQV